MSSESLSNIAIFYLYLIKRNRRVSASSGHHQEPLIYHIDTICIYAIDAMQRT
jgi:hypothetical protein